MAGKMQQYLRTEYIQPPPGPPTLDAKNSPLALLAQTCSAIGKELSGRKHTLQTKLSTANDMKQSTSITTSHRTSISLTSPVVSSPQKPSTPPMPSEDRISSPRVPLKREKSPNTLCPSPTKRFRGSPESSKPRDLVKSYEDDTKSTLMSQTSVPDHKRFLSIDKKRRHTTSLDDNDVKPKTDPSSTRRKSPSTCSPNNLRAFEGSCGCPTSSVSSAVDASRHGTHSASTSPQQMMSLYDPFCVGCQGSHVAGNPCFEGLKSPQLPFYPFSNSASAYPFYAQMLMAATARNRAASVDLTPHVCNWVNAGSGSCGERFSTADELFLHLRSHAVETPNANGSNFLMSGLEKMSANPYAAYLSQQAAALAAVSPTASNHNFLTRSHSPLSRYYPYNSKTSNMLSQMPGMPSLPIAAGSSPYCSPYALYGQRLGAAASGFIYP